MSENTRTSDEQKADVFSLAAHETLGNVDFIPNLISKLRVQEADVLELKDEKERQACLDAISRLSKTLYSKHALSMKLAEYSEDKDSEKVFPPDVEFLLLLGESKTFQEEVTQKVKEEKDKLESLVDPLMALSEKVNGLRLQLTSMPQGLLLNLGGQIDLIKNLMAERASLEIGSEDFQRNEDALFDQWKELKIILESEKLEKTSKEGDRELLDQFKIAKAAMLERINQLLYQDFELNELQAKEKKQKQPLENYLLKEEKERARILRDIYKLDLKIKWQQAAELQVEYDRLNRKDSGVFATLMGFGVATLFFVLNPLAALAAGTVAAGGYFLASRQLGKRKTDYFKDRAKGEEREYKRHNVTKSLVYTGIPLMLSAMVLAFPAIPIDAWLLGMGIFSGLAATLVPFLIPTLAIGLGVYGLYLQRKKNKARERLKELADLLDEKKLLAEIQADQREQTEQRTKLGQKKEETILELNEKINHCKTRRIVALGAGTTVVSGLAAAAFAFTLLPVFGVSVPMLAGSASLTGTLFGVLGISSLVVPPVAAVVAAAALIAVGFAFGRVAYKKWKEAKCKAAETKALLEGRSLEQVSRDSAPSPSSASEKAMGLTMATIAIVTSAVCTMGVALVLTGACALVYGMSTYYKHREGKLKSQKEAKLKALSEKKKEKEKEVLSQKENTEAPLLVGDRKTITCGAQAGVSASPAGLPETMEEVLRHRVPYAVLKTHRPSGQKPVIEVPDEEWLRRRSELRTSPRL